ncbi:MAG TPA: hypothetical protein VJN71_07240 [Nitrososphaerales archaeon]|nr:hypothetical protein [Nitrososphaerales archaeon]
MVYIDTTCELESFRRFLVQSTCMSFMPEGYLRDEEVFPEKEGETGSIYIEAADKVTLKKIRDITFVNARDILGIIYVSKSGNTRLKWRQSRADLGKVTGEASTNSLVNLFSSHVLSKEYTDELMQKSSPKEEEAAEPETRAMSGLEGTLNVEGDV